MDISQPINPWDKNLTEARKQAKKLCQQMNAIAPEQMKARTAIYKQLFGAVSKAYIEPNFFCDYGCNIFLGESFYANHNCVILDAAEVRIGDRVMLGPAVQIYATNHPLEPDARATGIEFASPVSIGDDCWIGGGAIIMPGVTIGKGCVIGAGALVTKDIPDYSVAVGNPAKVIKTLLDKTNRENTETITPKTDN